MNGQPLFSEKQYFRQPWIFLLFGGISLLFIWAFVQQIILGEPWGNNPAPDGVLIALILTVGLGLPAFILSANLSVVVEQDRMLVRFFPLHLSHRVFTKAGVASHRVVDYRPLRDYGGWGIRYGMKGKAYNVSGTRGVLFELPDGSTLLIGSRRPEEFDAAVTLMESYLAKTRSGSPHDARSDWLRKR